MNLHDTKEALRALLYQLNNGCGNNGCIIHEPKGMGTNATCQCRPMNVTKELGSIVESIIESNKAMDWNAK